MTDKLSLYNGALDVLGERNLANLTENLEPRHKLDDIWDNGVVKAALQKGQWNFATRAVQLDFSPDVTPAFGFQYAFDKPTDLVRTVAVCVDPDFQQPLQGYKDEAGWWWSDMETIFVRYVSNDVQYGLDFSLWPENFKNYVEHLIAYRVAPKIVGFNGDRRQLKKDMRDARSEARSTDAMEDPTGTLPRGTWSRSRRAGPGGRNDGGSTSRLIG